MSVPRLKFKIASGSWRRDFQARIFVAVIRASGNYGR
jgi:hypothetical protein